MPKKIVTSLTAANGMMILGHQIVHSVDTSYIVIQLMGTETEAVIIIGTKDDWEGQAQPRLCGPDDIKNDHWAMWQAGVITKEEYQQITKEKKKERKERRRRQYEILKEEFGD